MAIDFRSGTGLFDRLGQIFSAQRSYVDYLGTTLSTKTNGIRDKYLASRTDLIDGLYQQYNSAKVSGGSFLSFLRQLASNTVIGMADDDAKLVSLDLSTALAEVIRQMEAASETILRPTVSASATAGSANLGNGQLVLSTLDARGRTLDYVLAETIDFTVTNDSGSGATAGQEQFQYAGDAAQSDVFHPNWPDGSGCAGSISAVNAAISAGSNLLTNSSFENFSVANTPDNWTIVLGTPGTQIQAAGAGNGYAGATSPNGLVIQGDGSQLTELTQQFGQSVGTTATLQPNTQYAVSCWMKRSSGLAAGVLEIRLIDGSGTVINDDSGTANTLSQTLSALTTSYVAKSASFRTPRSLPSTVKIQIKLTTAATANEKVFLDHLALAEMTELYSGGPFAALFSGSVNWVRRDTFAATISNNYGGKFARDLDRNFDLKGLRLRIPSVTSGNTISESLLP
jgi:hypothetical protein